MNAAYGTACVSILFKGSDTQLVSCMTNGDTHRDRNLFISILQIIPYAAEKSDTKKSIEPIPFWDMWCCERFQGQSQPKFLHKFWSMEWVTLKTEHTLIVVRQISGTSVQRLIYTVRSSVLCSAQRVPDDVCALFAGINRLLDEWIVNIRRFRCDAWAGSVRCLWHNDI